MFPLLQVTLSWSFQSCTMPVCVLLLSLSSLTRRCFSHSLQREVDLLCNDRTIDVDIQEPIPYIHLHITLKDCSTLMQPDFFCLAVLQMTGDNSLATNPPVFWRAVLKLVGNTTLNSCVQNVLCLQWAIWLATCQLKLIEEFQVQVAFSVSFLLVLCF